MSKRREWRGHQGKVKAHRLVCDQVAVLAQDVGSDLDDILVARRAAEELEDLARGVLGEERVSGRASAKHNETAHLLQLLRVGDDLHDAVPHLLANMIPRHAHQPQDGVDVPLVLDSKLLGQDGNF